MSEESAVEIGELAPKPTTFLLKWGEAVLPSGFSEDEFNLSVLVTGGKTYLLESGAKVLPRPVVTLFPQACRGFYISLSESGWLFGRPKGGELYWEPVELLDLLNLGVDGHYLEGVVAERTYFCPVPGVVPQVRG